MPTKEEQLKWLQKKANEAKGNAGMLNEALAFAVQIEGNELVAVSFNSISRFIECKRLNFYLLHVSFRNSMLNVFQVKKQLYQI